MSSKKGAIEVQFNWIFVLIAGAIILGMFFAIAASLKEGSSEKIDLEISTNLKSALIGAKTSTGSSSDIPLPGSEITIESDGIKIGSLQSIKMGTVFGPRQIEGSKMIVWSRDWSIPFRISNFLYITTPKIKYYFIRPGNYVGGNSLEEGFLNFFDEIPEKVNLELLNDCDELMDITFSSSLHIKVIIFGEGIGGCDEPNIKVIKNRLRQHKRGGSLLEVNVFDIDPDMPVLAGEITMWSKWPKSPQESIGDIEKVAFYGDATLYGAIFSDPEVYQNSMKNAGKTATMVFNLYQLRLTALQNWADSNDKRNCLNMYNLGIGAFGEMSDIGREDDVNILDSIHMLGENKDGTPKPSFHSIINDLNSANEGAMIESCPTIY